MFFSWNENKKYHLRTALVVICEMEWYFYICSLTHLLHHCCIVNGMKRWPRKTLFLSTHSWINRSPSNFFSSESILQYFIILSMSLTFDLIMIYIRQWGHVIPSFNQTLHFKFTRTDLLFNLTKVYVTQQTIFTRKNFGLKMMNHWQPSPSGLVILGAICRSILRAIKFLNCL